MQAQTLAKRSIQGGPAFDVMKLLAALLVVDIHLSMFSSPDIGYYFDRSIDRIAVPFFFAAAGLFWGNPGDKKTASYFKRILLLYAMWSLVYLPAALSQLVEAGLAPVQILLQLGWDFIHTGTWLHMWYYPALIVSVALFFVLAKIMRKEYILAVSFGLFLLGYFWNTYEITLPFAFMEQLMAAYTAVFGTTRTGLFFGFFFVSFGVCLRGMPSLSVRSSIAGLLFSLVCLVGEVYLIHANGFYNGSLVFSTILVVFFLIHLLSGIQLPDKPIYGLARKFSVFLFGVHLFINKYLWVPLAARMGMGQNNLLRYVFVVLAALVLFLGLLWVSRFRYGKWLKHLW